MSDEWTKEILGWTMIALLVTAFAFLFYSLYRKGEDKRALSERCAATCAPYASHGDIDVEGRPYCVCSNVDENLIIKEAK